MKTVVSVLRWAAYALAALPLAFAPLAVRLRVPRRLLGVRFDPQPSALRAAAHTLLSGGMGLLAWFLLFLATVAAVRGIAYPLLTGDDYENSWGGPTLGGAWAVHAALGIGLLPVWAIGLAGLGQLQVRLARRLLGRTGAFWSLPLAVLLACAGVLLFISWLHQI
ncbi:hypothetical protein [Nocardia sp. XZ_19_385]|uniref:hypothetical protein n=1 Tax=Nocardia sp. XZ_19_385 TaxID=2769488 RepID=UPI0018903207|nr:hypothetical protein [Nocardia sp. XZ_19_385]